MPGELDELQTRVGRWVRTTFTDGALTDRWERAARVVEEAIELGQAEGLSDDDVYRLLKRVYARPAGHVEQEAGGLMVCLLAWAAGRDTSLAACALMEMERIETPQAIEKIRRKQSEKAVSGTGHDYSPPPGKVA